MEGRRTRIRPDKAFKNDAVRLVVEAKRTVPEVARDLGIHENTLYRWVKEQKDADKDAFPGHGRLLPRDAEMKRLKKELDLVKEERDILKIVPPSGTVFSRRP